METYEVGIIGAGIHGASAAYHLGSRSVRTIVFEKDTPASGPTGRSSAVCRAFYTNEHLARIASESIDLFGRFPDAIGGDAGFHRTGMLYLHPADDAASVRASAERLNELGITIDLCEPTDLATREPRLALAGVALGAWEPGAGYADPAATTNALFDRAVASGVVARLTSRVASVDPIAGGGAIVVTDGGEATRCERLLLAAGPWTKPLAAMVGADLPLTVERHIVATFGWGGATPLEFGFADLPGGYYCKPEGADLFCLGPLTEGEIVDADSFDENVSAGEAAELAEAVVARVPSLADAEARGGWASLYDVSPDWQPVIGEIANGIFVNAGSSGHGFKLGPALGRVVADLVMGKPVDPGLQQFHPTRFESGTSLAGGYRDIRILG